MVAYGASGLLGLLRNRLLAARFFGGREDQLDAYFAAFVLPDTIFQLLILGALSAAFIPVFTSYLSKDKPVAWHVVQSSMTIILLLFVAVSTGLFIFASPASRLLAPNFSDQLIQLTASLTRIMLAAQFFFALSSFMTGILQSHHRFLLPATAPIAYNLGIITGIVALSPIVGIYGPAIGVVLGALLHFMIQLPLALRLGFRLRLVVDLAHPGVRRIKQLMPARAATLAIGQVERVVAVIIISSLTAGTLAVFNFARQLYVLPINLFGATLGQASFPTLSNEHGESRERFTGTVAATVLQIAFFTLPAAALLLVLRIPTVRLVFGARQFPWEATILTGKVVALFALSVPAQSVNQLLVRAFYAAHNTRLPLFTAIITTLLLVLLAPILALELEMGVLGVVLAIVVADAVNMMLLVIILEKRIASGLVMTIWPTLSKMLVSAGLMAVFLWVPMRVLDRFIFDTTRTIPLVGLTVIAGFIGLTVYLSFSKLFRVQQLEAVTRLIHRVGNWRKVLEESEEVLEPTSLETSS
jgi:putative peptidoglycan lipid II flippase